MIYNPAIHNLEDLIPVLEWLPETAIVVEINYHAYTPGETYRSLTILFTWDSIEREVYIVCTTDIYPELSSGIRPLQSVREILDAIYSVTRPTVEIQFEA